MPNFSGIPVELKKVRRAFSEAVVAVERFDLQIKAGEFVALLGPSGCGKSTILRIIAGLDRPTSGEVQLGLPGSDSRRLAFVFQDAHLLPWRNALENVALPLEFMGMGRDERNRTAAEALGMVGLTDASRRYPAELSGGMRMRVSLARALVTKPGLLLLDEPFAALDEITRQQLDEQLYRLWYDRRMTVVLVTHSIMEATFLAERTVVLSRRPARTLLDRSIDLPVGRDAGLRTTAHFVKEMGILSEALERG